MPYNNYQNTRPTNKTNNYSTWTEDRSETFINPYNFVSLTGPCTKRNYDEYFKAAKSSGWIECEIETKSPVILLNTSNDDFFNKKQYDPDHEHKSFDFYSYKNHETISETDDKEELTREKKISEEYPDPVISGSSLRGIIRSVFEVITGSCLSSTDEDRMFYKRTAAPKKPGILRKKADGSWELELAERVRINRGKGKRHVVTIENKDYEEKKKIYIKNSSGSVTRYSLKPEPEMIEGWVHKGEQFQNKKYESIFIKGNGTKVSIDDDTIRRLERVLKLYREETINSNLKDRSHTGYKDFKVEDGALVYTDSSYKYLSPACMTKEVFETTLLKILKEQGNYDTCKSKDQICFSCAMFGTLNTETPVSSKIRITDAEISEKRDNYYMETTTLNELASPKPSATEFYLERPKNNEAESWNYDYILTPDQKNKKAPITKKWDAKIRGRKFYWHAKKTSSGSKEITKRNITVRPLKSGTKFTFKVYFDNITDGTLNKLLWTLNFGDNENQNCHKIGHAKPFGYGSIKIKIKDVKKRKLNITEDGIEYGIEPFTQKNILKYGDHASIDELLTITDYSKAPNLLEYPKGDDGKGSANSQASHQWFIANKFKKTNTANGSATRPIINYSLPKITDSNITLPKFIKK